MPRGWYLAQGLIPLGYSSSDDDEGPCELPNGRLVCGPHGLVQCGRCCTDYSYMDEDDGDEDEDDEDEAFDLSSVEEPLNPIYGPSYSAPDDVVRGTGLVFPSKFAPGPNSLPPLKLFRRRVRFMNVIR